MGWGGTKKNRKQRIVLLACFFSQDGRKEGRWKNRLPGEDIPGFGSGHRLVPVWLVADAELDLIG